MENRTSSQLLNTSLFSKVCLTLEELNASKVDQRFPTVVFLCVLISIGTIGNAIVIIVYSIKYSRSIFRLYIITLGVIDLLSCCIAMPLEVADNALPLLFHLEEVCKSGRFLGNIFKISSAFLLAMIAAERYKKICHPFRKRTTLRQAQIYCAAAVIFAVGLSWPNAFVQGIRHVFLPCNLIGYDCTVGDRIRNTKYPFIYSTVLFVVYIVIFLLLTFFYTLIIFSLRKLTKKQSQRMSSSEMNKLNPRFNKLMFAISMAFIVCHLPNCILDAISTFVKGHIFPPSPIVLGTLPLLARTFFINNVINPFIYLVGDTKFRNIIKKCFRWVFYKICHPNRSVGNSFVAKENIQLMEMRSASDHTKRQSTTKGSTTIENQVIHSA